MRAYWDSSKLENVRTKVRELRKSLRLVERKLRDARESLILPELKKTFGIRSQVTNQDSFANGLVFKPLQTASLGRFGISGTYRIFPYKNNNLIPLDKDPIVQKLCEKPCESSKEGNVSFVSLESKDTAERSLSVSYMYRLTSSVHAAIDKAVIIQRRVQTAQEKLQNLNNKVVKIKNRIQLSEDALLSLRKRIEDNLTRFEILQQKAVQRELSDLRIIQLEKCIELAMERANAAETREGQLETRVLELEDGLEVFDMKIHRAHNVLYRMNSDELPGKGNYSVTMVLKRASLTRQLSSISSKGHAPIILDSCDEESSISDEAFD